MFHFENFRSRMQKLEGNDRKESADEDRMKGTIINSRFNSYKCSVSRVACKNAHARVCWKRR